MGRRVQHPSWCAEDYRCTAGHAIGEHRSEPYTMTRPGGLVAVIATTGREDRPYAEATMHLRVRLRATDDEGQRWEVRALIRALSAALDAVERAAAPERSDRPELPRGRHAA